MSHGTVLYGLMANPGHNRVYFESSKAMALAELELACRHVETPCRDFMPMDVEGIHLVTFRAEKELLEGDIRILSRLSFVFAIFLMENRPEGIALLPIRRITPYVLGEDITSILKYTGKTNELFTRMMINVGLFSSDYVKKERLALMDPVAGKGTGLYEAALSGWDAFGMEIVGKSVEESRAFFKRYLETMKAKHSISRERISGPNRSFRADVTRFSYAMSREAQKSGEGRTLVMVAGDSRFADQIFGRERVHLLVGDLPYGIQHGSHNQTLSGSLTRNPIELVRACLPAWQAVLKPGGVLVLAWNRHVLERDVFEELFRHAGMTVLYEPPYDGFVHRVDQAIQRDILVARKESTGTGS